MFVSSSIVTSAIFAKKKYPDLEMYFVENGKAFTKFITKLF